MTLSIRLRVPRGCQEIDLTIENLAEVAGRVEVKPQSGGDDNLCVGLVGDVSSGPENKINASAKDAVRHNSINDANRYQFGINNAGPVLLGGVLGNVGQNSSSLLNHMPEFNRAAVGETIKPDPEKGK